MRRDISRAMLPPICFEASSLWYQRLPLINFQRFEQYEPLRVMRQFGLAQGIPVTYPYDTTMHGTEGSRTVELVRLGSGYVALWDQRVQEAVHLPAFNPIQHEDVYMPWYRSITRMYLVPGRDPVMRGGDPVYFPRAAAERGWVIFSRYYVFQLL